MNALNVSFGYKNIVELFDLQLATGDLKEKKEKPGSIPLVSAGKFNNGIAKRISQTTESNIFPAGCITVDMFGKAFYQDELFYCVSHGRVNILKPKFVFSEMTGLFLVTAIDKCFEGKYSFNKMCSQTQLGKEKLWLPLKSSGVVDFQYMEDYMRSLPYGDLISTIPESANQIPLGPCNA